jgi:hypothetical protein
LRTDSLQVRVEFSPVRADFLQVSAEVLPVRGNILQCAGILYGGAVSVHSCAESFL